MNINAVLKFGLVIAGSALLAAVLLAMADKNAKWLAGYCGLLAYGSAFAVSPDKKKYLIISLLVSFAIPISIFIWQPAPLLYPHGNGPMNAPQVYAFDLPLALLAFYVFFMKNKNRSEEFIKSDVLAVLLVLFYLLSLSKSEYPALSVSGILVALRMPVIYYCLSRGVVNHGEIKPMVKTLVLLLGIEGGVGIMQAGGMQIPAVSTLLKQPLQAAVGHVGLFAYNRPFGTIGYTTDYAQYLGMLFPMALTFYLFEENARWQLFSGVSAILGLVGILLSLSRIEWINVAVIFIFLLSIGYSRKITPIKIAAHKILVMIIGLAVLSAMFSQRVIGRVALSDHGSAQERILMANVALKMISRNAVLGVGANNYTEKMHDYGIASVIPGAEFGVHNSFLYLAAETGILSLITMLLLWWMGLRRSWFCFRHGGQKGMILFALGLFCGMLALFNHSMVEPGYHCQPHLSGMLWSMFGMAAAATAITKSDARVALA